MGKTLFLFIDESGNFDFSSKGTKYFVLSCISTFNPVEEREGFIALRYKLLSSGINQEYFHATEDAQSIRDEVFNLITSLKDDIEIHSVIAQKNKANPSLYIEEKVKKEGIARRVVGTEFYQRVCRCLLKYVFERTDMAKANKIVVVLGAIFTRDKQSFILKTLKKYLKEHSSATFEIFFHRSEADINCQIADYCGWAIAIKWERNEERSYMPIKDKLRSEFDIFRRGRAIYYDY